MTFFLCLWIKDDSQVPNITNRQTDSNKSKDSSLKKDISEALVDTTEAQGGDDDDQKNNRSKDQAAKTSDNNEQLALEEVVAHQFFMSELVSLCVIWPFNFSEFIPQNEETHTSCKNLFLCYKIIVSWIHKSDKMYLILAPRGQEEL
jgi:hypothetical protein